MIKYDAGNLGLLFVFGWKGSVFPKALLWAVPNAIMAFLLHMYARQEQVEGNLMSMTGVNMLWGGYTSVLGFLVVFRNNQAYTRFWEGATLINQVRGEWFNAVSTLFAFCNHAKEFQEQVETFQHTLVRLASMLYCSALQQVCDLEDDTLEIIENQGMDSESLSFMQDSNDRCEILLQWIQRLIVDSEEQKTIKIAPPLLTRAFQELSRGIVNLNNARKIKDIPFPFPYAQMITCMLVVHWIVTPILASQVIESQAAACVVCFFVTFAFWCLIYIALEIDQPFGEDDNDLPIREMQRDFNQSLLNLMHPLAQKVPSYQVSDDMAKPKLTKSDSTVGRVTIRASSSLSIEALAEAGQHQGHEVPTSTCGMTSPSARSGFASTRSTHTEHGGGWLNIFKRHSEHAGHEEHRNAGRGANGSEDSEATPPVEPKVLPIPSPDLSGSGLLRKKPALYEDEETLDNVGAFSQDLSMNVGEHKDGFKDRQGDIRQSYQSSQGSSSRNAQEANSPTVRQSLQSTVSGRRMQAGHQAPATEGEHSDDCVGV